MAIQHRQFLRFFTFRRIAFPVLIGFSVASLLLIRDFNPQMLAGIQWGKYSAFWFLAAIMLLAVRDIANMYRIRLLTNRHLTWRRSFQVVMLWEFASSVTPAIIGGWAVALFVVRKEGLNMGRTTAAIFTTSLLDEIFYITMVSIVVLIAGAQNLFPVGPVISILGIGFSGKGIFLIGYLFIIILASVILYGIFINPHSVKLMLTTLFRFKFLRKWRDHAETTGDELIVTANEMRKKPVGFWLKAYLATTLAWTARFGVVNALMMAFIPVSEHLMVYARQLVMWVILLISPTPGSSGAAEYFFPVFLGEFIGPGLSSPLAIIWRLISYYPYIFIGIIVLPHWIRRVYFFNRRNIRFRQH